LTIPSHVVGATGKPLVEHTIGQALDLACEQWSEQEALVCVHQNLRFTWQQLRRAADDFAAGLLALGLQKGDRVGIWAPNCAEWTITQFATARAGIIVVSINPAYTASELKYTLNKVGVSALVCVERVKSTECVNIVETVAPELFGSTPVADEPSGVPSLRHVILIGGKSRPGWRRFADVSQLGSQEGYARLATTAKTLDRHDPINVQFTSGTTGHPKGATLSHRNILNNGSFVGAGMGLRVGDRLCIPVPLYHCFGMVMGNLACLVHGAAMIYPAEIFDPLAVLRTCEQERCTGLHGVPTMFIAELAHPAFERFDLSSLRTGLMGGAPCPIVIMRQVVEKMHMTDIGIAYGMTETSPVSFQSTVTDSLEQRVTSIGKVQPHLEVKVVDDHGATVARNAPGELCTRGYSVMIGYWNDDGNTAQAIDSEGWMHTGDLAVIDDDGYGHIVGRIKDMVIRGGENIYPREIEEFLFTHPEIEAVEVVGVPDEKYGEELCAWIKLKSHSSLAAPDVIAFCKGRIGHYKIPKFVKFVTEFPTTVTGKIQKFKIREVAIRELGLKQP
jgi:fatty-acyl-CoA synthase